jgi:hypothetical protein
MNSAFICVQKCVRMTNYVANLNRFVGVEPVFTFFVNDNHDIHFTF